MVAQSLDAHGDAILGLYLPAEDSDDPPREQVLAVFERLSGWIASETFRGCPFVNTATELADRDHPARRVAREYKLRLRDYFAHQAERGNARDPGRLADQLLVIFDGAIAQTVMGIPLHPGTIRTAVQALLDAQNIR